MQGIYSRVKHRKENAVSGVKICPREERSAPGSPALVRTAKVLSTASFAVRPVMSAVDARQSPKPSGEKIGA